MPIGVKLTMGETLRNFGQRLRTIRKDRGISIETLGKHADLGYKHVADLERAVKTPSFEAIERLSKALGVSPHEFFVVEQPKASMQDAEESFRQIVNSIQRHGSLELKLFLTRVLAEAAKLFPGPAVSAPNIPKRPTSQRKRDRSKS
jgi:transcriptional regulator with XRE-family HTH domain